MSIERRRRQLARMRIAVATGWLVLVLAIVIGAIVDVAGWQVLTSTLGVVARAALVLAIFFTVSWYVRDVALRFDVVQQALAAIQEQLEAKDSPSNT